LAVSSWRAQFELISISGATTAYQDGLPLLTRAGFVS
jgi:hypothetical protein